MVTAILFLVILDAVILSLSTGALGLSVAIVVTLIVGALIAMIWRRNTRLEMRTQAKS